MNAHSILWDYFQIVSYLRQTWSCSESGRYLWTKVSRRQIAASHKSTMWEESQFARTWRWRIGWGHCLCFVCLSVCLFFVCSHFLMLGCLFACASLSASLSPCLPACLSVCLSVCLAVCLSLFVCLSVCLGQRRKGKARRDLKAISIYVAIYTLAIY